MSELLYAIGYPVDGPLRFVVETDGVPGGCGGLIVCEGGDPTRDELSCIEEAFAWDPVDDLPMGWRRLDVMF